MAPRSEHSALCNKCRSSHSKDESSQQSSDSDTDEVSTYPGIIVSEHLIRVAYRSFLPGIHALSECLTRFNKIVIQGTPHMTVDKEAICLSRVYSYYYKCNIPLCYVYPALTRYLYILFLNMLTLLACTHSSDNLFHTLMDLCENENFLTSNLLSFFIRVKLCPLVITFFNFEKNV